MDQDFHYYGTYYAARQGGFSNADATLIAKASNFIDFFSESGYAAYWKLVRDTSKAVNYQVVASMDNPRYTFQQGIFSVGTSPEDGLWCSFHFTPGNYDDPSNSPSRTAVHGPEVAGALPGFQKRDTNQGLALIAKYYPQRTPDFAYGKMLNRPQSALSRQLILDAIRCASDDGRLEAILRHAAGGNEILQHNRADSLRRLRLILLGIRAHVVADTWAHQDFSGIDSVLNTYWDVNYDPTSWDPRKMGYGRQSIDYNDGSAPGWHNQVLSYVDSHAGPLSINFEATPNGASYLGHGWMGHLPDFSFVQFRYKPCWADAHGAPLERHNPQEYRSAWIELVSLFTQATGKGKLQMNDQFRAGLQKAASAIARPCALAGGVTGRKSSANAWLDIFGDHPSCMIDANMEPDRAAVLDGMVEATQAVDRYGTDYVNVYSDLYLFQIAADYHFHFVKHYLARHGIYQFRGSWSQHTSALSPDVAELFAEDAVPA